MATALTEFIAEIDRARRSLNAVSGKQLHSQRQRDGLRGIVERYFNEVRATISGQVGDDDRTRSVDEVMQLLLALCHRRGTVRQYKRLLASAKDGLIAVDALLLSMAGAPNLALRNDEADARIIRTLQMLVPSAALSYQQAMADLAANERFSWRGPATDLRECLRETLDHLAPDPEVSAVPDYRQALETSGPTMKQKVRFILKSRGASKALSAPSEAAVDTVEEMLGTFVRSVYTRSNISTHTPTDRTEVLRVAELVKVVLRELLEIRGAR
jgi:hypothetical protein